MTKKAISPRPAWTGLILGSLLLHGCGGGGGENITVTEPPPPVEPSWARISALGGETTNTTGNQSSFGFDTPAANLQGDALAFHLLGDAEFETKFIKAPSTDFPRQDGLGPVFNNDACVECHTRDGRGNYTSTALKAPLGQWTKLGGEEALFLRISVPPERGTCVAEALNNYCAPEKVPGFSDQLFHRGVLGLRADSPFTGQADAYVRFETSEVRYADGETVTLYKPVFQIRNPYDSPGEAPGDYVPPLSRVLQADVMSSPRMGMPMFGLGLLEAIPESSILALADEYDSNADGISGRPNWVFDPVKQAHGDHNPVSLGRFGWKASTPSVAVQGLGAYHGDMGITSYLFPQESILNTALYDSYQVLNPQDDGQNGTEVSEDVAKAVMFYANTLAVPARRNVEDTRVLRGAALFESARCTACHTPSFRTGPHPGVWGPSGVVPVPEVAGQTIYPFSDMLLHDMGDALADNRPDFAANGREWKTRPLWGIGLTQTVNPLAGYLHDGRARTLEEAILWHGGEAEASREAFRTMAKSDRDAMLAFLASL
ncbi:MAG: di-heme oxidoredictase family protein [Pseudomonadota bacterium]